MLESTKIRKIFWRIPLLLNKILEKCKIAYIQIMLTLQQINIFFTKSAKKCEKNSLILFNGMFKYNDICVLKYL